MTDAGKNEKKSKKKKNGKKKSIEKKKFKDFFNKNIAAL